MTAASAMYDSFGFVGRAEFDGAEVAGSVLRPLAVFMTLDLKEDQPCQPT